jgi:hypothetical protein
MRQLNAANATRKENSAPSVESECMIIFGSIFGQNQIV